MTSVSDRAQRSDELFARGSELEDRGLIDEAVGFYERAARLGHPFAQSNLGNLLDDKIDPARPAEAVHWYKRSVRGGNAAGAWNLAMHYRNLGNQRWYLYWLRLAAKMGEEDAQALLP